MGRLLDRVRSWRWPVAPYSAIATAALTLTLVPWQALAPAPVPEPTLSVPVSIQGTVEDGPTQPELEAALEDVRVSAPVSVVLLGTGEKAPSPRAADTLYVSLGLPRTESIYSAVYAAVGVSTDALRAAESALRNGTALGAEATAVAAAVRSWDAALRETPGVSPLRIALIAVGSSVSLALLVWFLIRRRTWLDRRAAVLSARGVLAGLVLDLDALEAGTLGVSDVAARRTDPRYRSVVALCLDLLDREAEALDAVARPARAASAHGTAVRSLFVADVSQANAQAEQLNLATSFLAERAGAIGTWDRVIAPTVLATTQLLGDLNAAAPAVRIAAEPATGRSSLDSLLALGDDVHTDRLSAASIAERLQAVEGDLAAWAERLAASLEGKGASPAGPASEASARDRGRRAGDQALRSDLGLTQADPTAAIEAARAALAAYAGRPAPEPASLVLAPTTSSAFHHDPRRSRTSDARRAATGPGLRRLQLAGGVLVIAAVLGGSWIVAGAVLPSPLAEYNRTSEGEYLISPVRIEGRELGLDPVVLRNVADALPVPSPLELVIVGTSSPATRADRLGPSKYDTTLQAATYTWEERRALLREAAAALPGFIDPATGDLAQGKALVVVDGPEGSEGGAVVASSLGIGDAALDLSLGYGLGLGTDLPRDLETPRRLLSDVESVQGALALAMSDQVTHARRESVDPGARWVLTAALVSAFSALAALASGAVVGIGGLVRGAGALGRSLHVSARGLRELHLSLDDARLNAAAAPGGGSGGDRDATNGRDASTQENQRLFEAWGVQALREHERLAALRGARRRDPAALTRAADLQRLVRALTERDLRVAEETTLRLRSAAAATSAASAAPTAQPPGAGSTPREETA